MRRYVQVSSRWRKHWITSDTRVVRRLTVCRLKMQETHRSGPLKQQNKTHKHGRHRSGRQIQTATKGKMDVKKLSRRKTDRETSRWERRLRTKQMRDMKRRETIARKRSIGCENTPPLLVAVYSQSGAVTLEPVMKLIRECDEEATVSHSPSAIHVVVPKFKMRYTFLLIPNNDLYAAMDAVKVADVLMLVHSVATDEHEIASDPILTALYSHFLPTTVHVLNGIEKVSGKKATEIKSRVQKAVQTIFHDEKIHVVDKHQEALHMLHLIGNCKLKDMSYKSRRSQLLGHEVQVELEDGRETGRLIATGFVRNRPLNVNGLVHIPGCGDFQIEQIEMLPDPFPVKERKVKGQTDTEMKSLEVLKPDPMLQESLERENDLDPMEGEQNFPTAEEIAEAAAKSRKKIVKKVPQGTSEYQAVWIPDEDGAGDDEQSSDESSVAEDGMDHEPIQEEVSEASDSGAEEESEMASVTLNEGDDEKYDEKMDVGEEESMRQKYREARQEEMYPDEVDTPLDVPARVRFARYRGLRSFNYSSWDPKENLPSDYARIFQFQNFNRTRRRVFKDLEAEDESPFSVDAGSFVRLYISNVPQEVCQDIRENHASKPLLIYGLLKHEQKMSLVNVLLKKHSSCEEPVKSKEKLIFHIGCRRFAACPVFSAHTNGTKFKYERFLSNDSVTIASMYAPITFPPASVVVFKQQADGSQKLVATGSLLSVDPNRLVIKRVVLSGHPYKINKKLATIRYMFFNKEDIDWFKPIELKTKLGRKGHIKCSLGTHGHMKCYFDRQLDAVDTVLMNLYKRVFPKWTYEERVPVPAITC